MVDQLPGLPLAAEVETIKAKIVALNEMHRGYGERFSVMSEKLGELRYMLVSFGKEIEESKEASKKAIVLVEEIQPNRILAELRKSDAKAEILESKLESNEVLMNKIIAEIKEMRRLASQFEGIQKIQEMSESLRKSLKDGEKMEVEMKRESQVVKDVFMEVQEKLKEFRIFDERISGMGEEFKRLLREFDGLKAGYMQMAKVEDLERIKASIDSKLMRVDSMSEKISQEGIKLREFIQSEKAEKFAENLDRWLKAGVGLEASMAKLKEKVIALEELDRNLDKRESTMEKNFEDTIAKIKKEKDTGEIRKRLDTAVKMVDESRISYKRLDKVEKVVMAMDKRLEIMEKETEDLKKDIGAGVKRIILKQLGEI